MHANARRPTAAWSSCCSCCRSYWYCSSSDRRRSRRPPGHSVIVLYFVQTAMLEVGSAGNLLGWLNIALFSPNAIGQCIAPLTVYQQATFQIVMPLILFGELICVGAVHVMLSRYFVSRHSTARLTTPPSSRSRVQERLDSSGPGLQHRPVRECHSHLLLFSYTQVTVACLSYLVCVDVGGVSVVFTQPSMRCASGEYKRYLGLVVFALIMYVVGFPVAVLTFLWRRSLSRASQAQTHHGAVRMQPMPDCENALSSHPARSETSTIVLDFLRRYSPLFSMYSSRAWFWQVLVLVRRTIFVAFSRVAGAHSGVEVPRVLPDALGLAAAPDLLPSVLGRILQHRRVGLALLLILFSQSLNRLSCRRTRSSTEIYLFFLVVPPVGAVRDPGSVSCGIPRRATRRPSSTPRSRSMSGARPRWPRGRPRSLGGDGRNHRHACSCSGGRP